MRFIFDTKSQENSHSTFFYGLYLTDKNLYIHQKAMSRICVPIKRYLLPFIHLPIFVPRFIEHNFCTVQRRLQICIVVKSHLSLHYLSLASLFIDLLKTNACNFYSFCQMISQICKRWL